jgi:hypothetical protein
MPKIAFYSSVWKSGKCDEHNSTSLKLRASRPGSARREADPVSGDAKLVSAKRNRECLSPVSTRFLQKEVVKTAKLSGFPE